MDPLDPQPANVEAPTTRGRLLGWWGVVLACLVLFVAWPESTVVSRFYIAAGSLAAWAMPLIIWWPRRAVRFSLLGVGIVALGLVAGPGRAPDAETLRNAYVNELRDYEGVRYQVGGENRFGIDGAGLVRRAMSNTCLQRGLLTVNPRLVRRGLAIWWLDQTAAELGEGFGGRLRRLGSADAVNELPEDALRPGDLAVIALGGQVLAYLGDGAWLVADSESGRVTVRSVPVTNRLWFQQTIYLMRWELAPS